MRYINPRFTYLLMRYARSNHIVQRINLRLTDLDRFVTERVCWLFVHSVWPFSLDQPVQPVCMFMCSLYLSGSLYLSITPKFNTKVLHQTLNPTADYGVKPCLALKSIWCYTELKL